MAGVNTSTSEVDVVLVRPREPGNIGAVARVIANHGLGRLVLVAPPAFDADRARWMAPGAAHIVDDAVFAASVSEAVADHALIVGTSARRRRWSWPHWDPESFVGRALDASGRVAVLFGPEDAGLTNDDLARADALLVLPTAPHASLNLAQAVVVTAAHVLAGARARGEGPPGPDRPRPRRGGGRTGDSDKPASAEDSARLVDAAMPIVEESTFMRGRSEEQLRGTLYRMLRRAEPDQRELNLMRGMLAKLEWRLGQPPPAGDTDD